MCLYILHYLYTFSFIHSTYSSRLSDIETNEDTCTRASSWHNLCHLTYCGRWNTLAIYPQLLDMTVGGRYSTLFPAFIRPSLFLNKGGRRYELSQISFFFFFHETSEELSRKLPVNVWTFVYLLREYKSISVYIYCTSIFV